MPKLLKIPLSIALVAACLLLLAVPERSRAYTVQTVEVSEAGFNPGIAG